MFDIVRNKKKCGHLNLLFSRILKVGAKVGVKVATFSYGFTSLNPKESSLFMLHFVFKLKIKNVKNILWIILSGPAV